jgi:prepilin-type N-terminal cleavage/methylation domain-containing protein
MKSRRYKQDGFTLIEIMVVILILGLLARASGRIALFLKRHARSHVSDWRFTDMRLAMPRASLNNQYPSIRMKGFRLKNTVIS